MAKKKQEVKLKEPVRIRFKQLANGNQSIYLDYYTGDVIRNIRRCFAPHPRRNFYFRQHHERPALGGKLKL